MNVIWRTRGTELRLAVRKAPLSQFLMGGNIRLSIAFWSSIDRSLIRDHPLVLGTTMPKKTSGAMHSVLRVGHGAAGAAQSGQDAKDQLAQDPA
jgi:hypothetical protein